MRTLALLLLTSFFGCATATRFHTDPQGARLFIDGRYVGETPYTFHNDPGLPRRYHIQVKREGYEPLDFYLDTTLSWLWGYVGFFTFVPYLWAWSLASDYQFSLTPLADAPAWPGEPPSDEAPREERL